MGKASARSPPTKAPKPVGLRESPVRRPLPLPEPSTSNQNLVGGPTSFAGRPFGPRLPQLEAPQPPPASSLEGRRAERRGEKRRRSCCGGGRPMPGDKHGAGPPLCYSEPVNQRLGVDGLTLAAPPRACGYPTLFPPPEGRGGFNVSRFSDQRSGNWSARGRYSP